MLEESTPLGKRATRRQDASLHVGELKIEGVDQEGKGLLELPSTKPEVI